ncbi:MAG: hypothetical protein RIE56_02380 [Amphiplicatus sp.]
MDEALRATPSCIGRGALRQCRKTAPRGDKVQEEAISGKPIKDPAEAMRGAISRLEERVDSLATTLMGTEEFAGAANLAANLQLRAQKGMNDHMARQLAFFNMPSREDISSVGERLKSMDDRLVRIEAMLARIAGHAAQSPGANKPPRTKKPPKRDEGGDKKKLAKNEGR